MDLWCTYYVCLKAIDEYSGTTGKTGCYYLSILVCENTCACTDVYTSCAQTSQRLKLESTVFICGDVPKTLHGQEAIHLCKPRAGEESVAVNKVTD